MNIKDKIKIKHGQEYAISSGNKLFYGILGIGTFLFSVFLFTKSLKLNPLFLLFPLFILAISILFIASLRRKIIITENSILVISPFATKELNLSDIKGYRSDNKSTIFESNTETIPSINIGNYIDFRDSDKIQAWIRGNFTDLDAINLEMEREKILQDTTFGNTEKEREKKLNTSKETALAYNILGGFLGFIMIVYDTKFSFITLLVLPLIGIVLLYMFDLIKFMSDSRKSNYSHIMIGFMLPSLILMLKSTEYHLLDLKNSWLPIASVSAIVLTLLTFKGINRSILFVKGQIFIMFLVTLLYGFGSIRSINCVFDQSKEFIYHAKVINHSISRGKSTDYYLKLSTWGPQKEKENVKISKSTYDNTQIGDTVVVKYKKGLLDIPWYVVKTNNEH